MPVKPRPSAPKQPRIKAGSVKPRPPKAPKPGR